MLASSSLMQSKSYRRNEKGNTANIRAVFCILKSRQGRKEGRKEHRFSKFICLAATPISTSPTFLTFLLLMSFRFSLCTLGLLTALAERRRAVWMGGGTKGTSGQPEKIHHTCSFLLWPEHSWNSLSSTKFFLKTLICIDTIRLLMFYITSLYVRN